MIHKNGQKIPQNGYAGKNDSYENYFMHLSDQDYTLRMSLQSFQTKYFPSLRNSGIYKQKYKQTILLNIPAKVENKQTYLHSPVVGEACNITLPKKKILVNHPLEVVFVGETLLLFFTTDSSSTSLSWLIV